MEEVVARGRRPGHQTMAQTAVATIGAAAVLCEVSWDVVGSAAVLAGLLSLLTSLAGLPEVEG